MSSPQDNLQHLRWRCHQGNGNHHHQHTQQHTGNVVATAPYTTHSQFTSSSSLSTELSGINASENPNFDPRREQWPDKSAINNHSTKAGKPRKQHTLVSIEAEKSRSRSPIVSGTSQGAAATTVATDTKTQIRNDDAPYPKAISQVVGNQRLSSTNPFENCASVGQHLGSGRMSALDLSPVERISLRNFERQRSICSSDAATSKSRRPKRRNEVSDRESTDLSSDQTMISANLQPASRRLTNAPGLSSSSSLAILAAKAAASSNFDQSRLSSPENSTELQELKQKLGGDSGAVDVDTPTACSTSDLSSSESISNQPNGCSSPSTDKQFNSADIKKHEVACGFEIVWLNFTYSIYQNIFGDPRWGRINKLFHKEERMILKGLSGGFKSGQMLALMGPSGAGKTCLLECIAGIRLSGIGGEIHLRGRKSAQLVIVPQHDDFLPQFTVEEIITFGSKMKNSATTDHKAVADTVIEQLGLQACRANNIQKCSGGQRKRVAIAQELVSRPNILILDEPTSGLDSSCCYQTMRVLREVLDKSINTEQPMAIVTTIHQPSAKVFKMFDLIYLLGKSGYAAYSGPPDELLPTIRDITGLECPQYSNPSDYMIELVSYDYGEEPVAKLIEFEKKKAIQLVEDYEFRSGIAIHEVSSSITTVVGRQHQSISSAPAIKPQLSISSNNELEREQLTTVNGPILANILLQKNNQQQPAATLKASKSDTHLILKDSTNELKFKRFETDQLRCQEHVKYANNITVPLRKAASNGSARYPFFWHIYVHIHRSFLQSIRDPILNNMRILIHLGFATLLVLLYGKKSGEARGCPPIIGLPAEITDPEHESMIDLADNVGYLFMCIMMITYVSLMSTVLTFPIDIKTVGKEYKNGWYGTMTYFLGKTIADLPFIIFYPVAYCFITWFMTNQAQDHHWRFLSFTCLIIMNAINSQSFGLILGAVFVNSVTAATFLGPVITIPWYLFTGFTKRIHRLAEPYRTTSNFLFTRYVFEGLLDTVYGHQRCNCSEFLHKYYQLRYKEVVRLGHMVSAETLSSLDYYDGLETIVNLPGNKSDLMLASGWFEKTVDVASTMFADGEELNLASLMETNGKTSSLFSFGLDFEPTCPSNYKNFVIQDFRLDDSASERGIIATLIALSFIRVLTFIVVAWKIRTRQL